MKKTISNLFLMITVLVALLALSVSVGAWSEAMEAELALPLLEEGACGYVMKTTDGTTPNDGTANDFYWQINEAGTLIISHKTPEGATPSNSIFVNPKIGSITDKNVPWYSYRSQVKKVVFDVEDSFGIGNSTYIASYLFAGLTNCTTVVIPSDVKVYTYGPNMFNGCTKLITFGPEGTPEGTYDLRNVVGSDYGSKNVANGNNFSNCATGANITVLMPYATTLSKSTVPCIGYNWQLTSPIILDNFQNAASVIFKTLPGTVGATVAEAHATTYDPDETGKWTVVSYADNELPLFDANACGYVMKTTDGTTPNDGTANDFYWQVNAAGTLIISHKTVGDASPSVNLKTYPSLTGSNYSQNIPWWSYRDKITKIVIAVDSTISIEEPHLFRGLTNCTTVVTPDEKMYVLSSNMFNGCTKLVTFGPEGTAEGTFDLRNVVGTSIGKAAPANSDAFVGCGGNMDITVLMPYSTSLSRETVPLLGYNWNSDKTTPWTIVFYDNFTGAKSVTFKTLPGSTGDTVAKAYVDEKNTDAKPWKIVSYAEGDLVESGTGRSEKTTENWYCDFKYSLDLVTGVLNIEFTSGTKERFVYSPNSVITNLSKEFGPLVTRVNFIGFIQLFEDWKGTFLPATMTNLKTVDIGTINNFRAGSTSTVWFNCPALTTFGSSARGTLKEGVIDLTGIEYLARTFKLFNGCSGVKELIVPDNAMASVTADTFAGLANVEKITIGKMALADGAFDHMTALKTIVVTDKTFADDSANKLLPVNKSGLTVICFSKSAADSLTDYGATKVIYFGDVVIPEGFSVRTNKTGTSTNGLRTLYKFDTARRTALEDEAGFKFKEFGGIVVSTTKLGSNTLSLSWNGEEYVPNIAGAIKAPVFIGDEQVNNALADGDANPNTIEFAITLVNLKDNYTTDIYSCGYAIFVDAAGNEYIEYVNYGDLDGKADWKYVNIFDLAMYLYTERYDSVKNIVADEAPVWGILGTGAIELENSKREITLADGNTAMMIVKDSNGAYNLFVRCLDGTMPALTDAQAKATALGYTNLANSIGIKVKEDPDFFTKSALEAYVDKKLEAARLSSGEKAKSFIFVTDTHWAVDTKNDTKVTFATDVMKYVSDQLGGAAVIYGGDPYGGFNEAFDESDPYANINKGLGIIDDYVLGELKATFGNNFFYALGNHDTNIIGYQNAMKSTETGGLGYSKDIAMEYYLISDKDMYDHTVGVFADKGIVFDEDGIVAIKNVLTNNGYSDEKTLSEAEYMMKMHYHYDDVDAKVRYIVVDTGGCGRTQMGLYKAGWNGMLAAQYKWLANTLKGTPAGYDVVVVGHQIAGSKVNLSDGDADFQEGQAELYDVISAFKTGADVTVRYPATSWHEKNYGQIFMDMVEYGTADIDFEVPFEGTVFTIGGHVHTDNGWYVNNNGKITDVQFGDEGATVADGAVLALTTGTARKNDTDPAIDGYEMGSSFPNNIRFDVVTIREDGSVLLTRIGAGNDRIYSYAG